MRMRPTYGAAVVVAATLAATVGSPGPAEAFFFLPIFQKSQPSFESRTPSDNNRWRRGDRARDEAAEPVKPSTGTRAKRDEEKSSSTSSGKSGKSQAKSEASSSQAFAHPQRSSGAASEQEQRPRQRLGAPGKPRGRRHYAGPPRRGPAQLPQRERRRAGAQFRPRRQHPRRYLRREARRGVQGEDRRAHQAVELAGCSRSTGCARPLSAPSIGPCGAADSSASSASRRLASSSILRLRSRSSANPSSIATSVTG